MAVCRYFIQGNCRYGDKCWNDHPTGNRVQGYGRDQGRYSDGYRGGMGVTFKDNKQFGQNQNRFAALSDQGRAGKSAQQLQVKDMSPSEVLEMIGKEMEVWESGNIWPFSCYAHLKDGDCFPGFEDVSPEELRFEAYTAKINGILVQYEQKVAQLSDEYKKKRQNLKNTRGMEMHEKQKLLQYILNQQQNISTSNVNNSSSGFGSVGYTTSSLFGGGSASTQSIFGSSGAQNSSVFGGTSSNSAVSLFASPQTQPHTLFGKSVASFGTTTQTDASAIGANPPASSSGSQAETGSFGISNFGQPATGLFGKAVGFNGTQQSAFGTSLSNNPVAQPSSVSSSALSTPQPTPLGSPTATPSSSGFSLTQSGASSGIQNSMFTPLNELTTEEKEQFQAAKFTLGKIPTRPPPKELCF